MTNANDARRIVLQSLSPVLSESCPLRSSLGRILAQDIIAPHPVPQFDNSGMDGFALRTADLSQNARNILTLQGEVTAGRLFEGSLLSGHAIRITTGSPIPDEADAVVEQEMIRLANGSIEFTGPVQKGRNIRRRGEDIQTGAVVLAKGSRLDPAGLGVLASLGIHTVLVHRKIRVAILTTGNEVVDFKDTPGPGQIRNSNAVALEGMLMEDGHDVRMLDIAKDDPEDLRRKVSGGLQSDALVTSGGISVGSHDHMPGVLESLNIEMKFWKVNIKPGMPMAFGIGQVSDRTVPVFALPGNPVSTLVTYLQFVRPGLNRMSGMQNPDAFQSFPAVLEENIPKIDSKRHFVRGIFRNENGRVVVRSTGTQSSGVLTSLMHANCLIVVPEDVRNPSAGDIVEIQLL
ncbi:MAG TPA: gephyrin-like molybdotransferase Glp [Bacteroidota bacterium]|nr:gephyrin-like molybdotransferase Glp [Bacteroidota bacterium]